MQKKLFVWLTLLALCVSMVAGCGGKTSSQTEDISPAEETSAAVTEEPTDPETAEESANPRVFTDSCGREVEIPQIIESVAVSGPLAQIVLFALCPEKLAGLATAWNEEAALYLDTEYYNLPVLGQLYGGKGELNLEELLKSDAQLVIDIGESKDSIAADMDELQAQTGLPCLHIDAYTATMGDTYRLLGELLKLPEEAAVLADYCDRIYHQTLTLSEGLGEDKVSLLYCLGDEGLNVIAQGSYHSEVLDLLGDNLAVVDEPSSKGTGNETDLEQLLLWNPEVILFAPDSVYDSVGDDPLWQSLDAIASGRYYKVPFGPYNWLGFPPSVQRYLGMLWLGTLLYPDRVDYDLYEAVAEYYKLFYHCELSQAQYDALMQDALPQ